MTLKLEAPTSPSELKPLPNPICFSFYEHAERQKVLPLLCWAGQAVYVDSEVSTMEGFCRGSCFFARLCKQQVQTLGAALKVQKQVLSRAEAKNRTRAARPPRASSHRAQQCRVPKSETYLIPQELGVHLQARQLTIGHVTADRTWHIQLCSKGGVQQRCGSLPADSTRWTAHRGSSKQQQQPASIGDAIQNSQARAACHMVNHTRNNSRCMQTTVVPGSTVRPKTNMFIPSPVLWRLQKK